MNLIKEKFLKYLSISCLLVINWSFLYHYTIRISEVAGLISTVCIVGYFVLLRSDFSFLSQKKYQHLPLYLLIIFMLFASFLFLKIPKESITVDRYSDLCSFWEAAFKGDYPYTAHTVRGSNISSMPFFLLLALPFCLSSLIDYFSIFGIVLFLFLLKKENASTNLQSKYLIFLMSSAFFLWEIVARSNLFLNSTLILMGMLHFFEAKNDSKSLYINALLMGFLLSSRMVYSFPILMMLLFAWKNKTINLQELFCYGMVLVLAFLGTFLPILLNFPHDFFVFNPFFVQSKLTLPHYIILLIIAILLPFLIKNKVALFFSIGVFLMLPHLFFVMHRQDTVDISYIIFPVPFFMFHLFLEESILPEQT